MKNHNYIDDVFGSLKSLEQNSENNAFEKILYENTLSDLLKKDSEEMMDNSDILSISKSSADIINEKPNQIKDISNIQISFSNISELDPKVIINDCEEAQEEFNQKDLSISTNSIKICGNPLKRNKDLNSYTPSTLCNYYQHSNEVTPNGNEGKYLPFNPVNIHQVNLNLIYNNMNNTEDSTIIKSTSKKTHSQIKYTKAQCNSSNEGQIQFHGQFQTHAIETLETKPINYTVSHNDNLEFLTNMNKCNRPEVNNKEKLVNVNKLKPKPILIQENACQITIGKCDNSVKVDVKVNDNECNKYLNNTENVYFNGLRFGTEGQSNPFNLSTRKSPILINSPKTKISPPQELEKNNSYTIKSAKTESTACNSHPVKTTETNNQANLNIPTFSSSKKVKEIIANLITNSKSKSKPKSKSNSKPKKDNPIRNLTVISRNIKQTGSLKKLSSAQMKPNQNKSLSSGKNRNLSNDSYCKKIIKSIKSKEISTTTNDINQNKRPLSSLFVQNMNVFNPKTKKKPRPKVNTQINLASILSKFDRQPKKRADHSSRQSTICTFLNDTIINNQVNDTFSKIVHTLETNNTTEANTNQNNDHINTIKIVDQTCKYTANSSISSIKKTPKVIQNFSCYKKKNSFQSHFVSKEDINCGPIQKYQHAVSSLKLKKLEGDEDFNINDE